MTSCTTLEERMAENAANPCKEPWTPVFPKWLVGSIAPGVLLTGMTIIGYGLGTGKRWAISDFIKPSTQLTIMMFLMVADHMSSYWDHSRVSDEPYCLTSAITADVFDDAKARTIFGGLAVALAGVSAYGIKSGSITLSSTGIPFATMMAYLAWSPQTFQSCSNNALVTGTMAFGLDVMTFVGILELLFAESGNTDTSWHSPTIVYSVIICALYVLLIGKYSEYGQRITPGSCEIDDEKDLEEEKLVDRRPELYTGILTSVVSIVYFLYLKFKFTEVTPCSVYPVLMFLLFDILTKMQVWKKGESLVGDSLHRSIVCVVVQILDVMLSSSSMISVMNDKGLIGKALVSGEPMGLVKNAIHFAGGSLTYLWNLVKLVIAIITGSGKATSTSSMKRMAEVVKSLTLNVGANAVPLFIDNMNSGFMLSANPQNALNVKCFVD
jgi:hypothetical protein